MYPSYSTRSPHKHKTQTLNFRRGRTGVETRGTTHYYYSRTDTSNWYANHKLKTEEIGEICEQYNPDTQVGIQQ